MKGYDNMDIFEECFGNVIDFRQEGKVTYPLIEVIFMAVIGTIANGNSWSDIEIILKSKKELLEKYFPLDHGIPSHDTFQRIFEHLDPKGFNKAFMNWTNALSDETDGRIIAIDGKTLRRSFNGEQSAIHLVNAWVDENDMILGQIKTDAKSNEITILPEIIDLLKVKNSIVTIDAMGTQKKIAEKIIKKKADYVLSLKGNQGTFHKEVIAYFDDARTSGFKDIEVSRKTTQEKGHGRIEKREYYQTEDIGWFQDKKDWKGLKSIGMVKRTITIKDKTSEECAYFISSLEAPKGSECELFSKAVRNHWGIESCHWMLDVLFREDESRVRTNNGAENLSMLRKIALNILKQEIPGQMKKMSKNKKRLWASLDNEFFENILKLL